MNIENFIDDFKKKEDEYKQTKVDDEYVNAHVRKMEQEYWQYLLSLPRVYDPKYDRKPLSILSSFDSKNGNKAKTCLNVQQNN